MNNKVALYNRFKTEVIDKMEQGDVITRNQIMYQMNVSDMLVDRLMYYIKHNLCREGFNKNVMISHEGFRVEFQKLKRSTKMYIIKI